MTLVKTVDPRVSFAELCQWPDDGRRYELYDGELIVVPAPIPRHQLVLLRIGELMLTYGRATGGLALRQLTSSFRNTTSCSLTSCSSATNAGTDRHDEGHPRVPPDLAVEVLSRSTERRDRGRKMQLFARFNVLEYWIVDPVANTLEIYTLRQDTYDLGGIYDARARVHSPTLEGLVFDAAFSRSSVLRRHHGIDRS